MSVFLEDIVFDDQYGIGLAFSDDEGNEAISVYDEDYPRVAHLRITSFRGFSPRAKHYYGVITTYNLPFQYTKVISTGPIHYKVGDIADISGAYDKHKPKDMRGISIRLHRPVRTEEIRTLRFLGYKLGDVTECFSTKHELIQIAKETFRQRFSGRWVLREMYKDYNITKLD